MRYRMVPEELVFWMGPIDGEVDARYGVLCRRHADSLTVPRGWTLDDSRDPTLRLFRPTAEAVRRPRRETSGRAIPTGAVAGEQLVLDGTGEIERPLTGSTAPSPAGGSVIADVTHEPDPGAVEHVSESEPDTATEPDPVTDGIIRPPSSPLLARAFRGTPLER